MHKVWTLDEIYAILKTKCMIIYMYNYSHTAASSSKVVRTTFNSCPSLWSSSPISRFEFTLVAQDDVLVPHVVMTTPLNRPWEAPVFWHFDAPCLGLVLKSMPLMLLITVESIVKYTLCLGLMMTEEDLAVAEEDDLAVMEEGDLGSSLTSVSWPQQWTIHNTYISKLIWGEHNLPLFELLFFSFQHRLHAWVTGPMQGDLFRQIQALQG